MRHSVVAMSLPLLNFLRDLLQPTLRASLTGFACMRRVSGRGSEGAVFRGRAILAPRRRAGLKRSINRLRDLQFVTLAGRHLRTA
ncbi:MAG: hypothetical protein H0T58_08905 [Gemmatimonadales bacterium]|nr:hypothetical protein [Gemmatimonadales bacterium]